MAETWHCWPSDGNGHSIACVGLQFLFVTIFTDLDYRVLQNHFLGQTHAEAELVLRKGLVQSAHPDASRYIGPRGQHLRCPHCQGPTILAKHRLDCRQGDRSPRHGRPHLKCSPRLLSNRYLL